MAMRNNKNRILSFRVQSAVRIDELLRSELPRALGSPVSNSKIRRLVVAGAVCVDGRQVRVPSFSVRKGGSVSVSVDEEKLFFEKKPDDIAFELSPSDVLFEDDSVIVVNKPSMFPTEAGMVGSRDNLHDAVVRFLFAREKARNPNMRNPPYVGIMHRLDRETSGAILFTKTRAANAPCHDMFENHTARKTYRAVSTDCGCCFPLSEFPFSFAVSFPMGRISPKSQAAKWGKVSTGGVDSLTEFTVLGRIDAGGKKAYAVECRPLTGRTHQIRVHLASVGLPILGDELYGGDDSGRIMLHAASLSFPHPVTGDAVFVSAPLPPSFGVFEGAMN